MFRDIHASALLGSTYRADLERSGVDANAVENVIAGCVHQYGEQGAQQAVGLAAAQIAAGVHDVVVGGGVEHMGHVPISAPKHVSTMYGAAHSAALLDRYQLVGQGLAAERMSERWSLSRSDLDALAVRSQLVAMCRAGGLGTATVIQRI